MVYKCENEGCLFLFERSGPVENCPDCGSPRVHIADNEDIATYLRNKSAMRDADSENS